VFQFSFVSAPPFYLTVTPGNFEFCAGVHEAPTLKVMISDYETCWGLLDGRLDGMQAFMEGNYRADGNIVLSQLLLYLFKSNDPTIAYEIQY
jgi:putative sterol carrier protein